VSVASVVDLVLGRMFGVLLAEVADSLRRAAVPRGCVAVPAGSVALADMLEQQRPGVELVGMLEALEPGDLHDAALVEAVAARERVASLAAV